MNHIRLAILDFHSRQDPGYASGGLVTLCMRVWVSKKNHTSVVCKAFAFVFFFAKNTIVKIVGECL